MNTLVSSLAALFLFSQINADATSHSPPVAVGTIADQTIFVPNDDCGPMSLHFDLTPYFDGQGEALTYCLSHLFIEGDASNLTLTLNPFTGMLDIPVGWFGINTTINLKMIAKNPYGSISQTMKIFLEPCGG